MDWVGLADAAADAARFCVSCICDSGNCISPGEAAAGAAGAVAAAAGDPWYRRAWDYWSRRLPDLPVFRTGSRGKLRTDGRWSYGAGPPGFKTGVDVGAAPGSDPRGPIVDVNVRIGGRTVSNHGVAIAPEIQGFLDASGQRVPQSRRAVFGH